VADGTTDGGCPPREESPWQVIRSETLIDSPWLRVRRQRVRTARGYEIPEYYLLDAPDIVVVLALTEARDAILIRQYRHGIGHASLELPAGMIDPTDPTPPTAAERELLEETGYRPARLELLGRLHPSTARQSNVTHCFLALDCHPAAEPGGDPAEDISLELLPVADLRAVARRSGLASQTSLSCIFLGLERLRELGLEC
jgi:8-oxo-dGTP pyrophosphatase MutT (NUDIX family)